MKPSSYVNSWQKRGFDLMMLLVWLPVWLPLTIFVGILVGLLHGWPIIFKQARRGKNGKDFAMYKFRTMRNGAQHEQVELADLNEADGPVFKIKNDPRFVGIGKWLAYTGLDELPQFMNVLKGEMSLVGPRPLPTAEAEKIPEKFRQVRELVKPGIVSEWVVKGAHQLPFIKWMESDRKYIKQASLLTDVVVLWKSGRVIGSSFKIGFKNQRIIRA
jgi:lipopolysaccharide/colanic/teichoic acid biosynthesis glycosyltransferase